jgi:hypothetical protein
VTGRYSKVHLEVDKVWAHRKLGQNWTGLECSDWEINNLMESYYWITNQSHAIESFVKQGVETLFSHITELIRG